VNRDRVLSLALAAGIHLVLLFGVVITIKTALGPVRETPEVMKLADIREASPPPAPSASAEAAAENIVEADDAPGEALSGPGDNADFLPMHLVSVLPRFPEDELRRRKFYPPMAQRAGIEGTVYLEIFVDSTGLVRHVAVLKEDPPGRGFGEAALKVFQNLQGSPALVNGKAAAARYRYPVRFSLE
jgi:protein TonB